MNIEEAIERYQKSGYEFEEAESKVCQDIILLKYCGFCGSLLTRRNWHSGTKNSITVWHCMEFVKHGKENCPYCKAMKESIIEEAFTESYKLLCNNNEELIQTFLNEMQEIIQEESNESSIKKLEDEKQGSLRHHTRLAKTIYSLCVSHVECCSALCIKVLD